jgi:hypothetical protein
VIRVRQLRDGRIASERVVVDAALQAQLTAAE